MARSENGNMRGRLGARLAMLAGNGYVQEWLGTGMAMGRMARVENGNVQARSEWLGGREWLGMAMEWLRSENGSVRNGYCDNGNVRE
ncbi:hypothetical protein CEXT_138481 [Caerostris extrusa]|uniref:Uncharacterized protein n=1 Tax=Caerostris extrusa TaxID=172846 RepID=A0AAV4VNU3_CAEEX|nr:hypothetical protein CEXT_138481 [Caerostris extrusa]